MKALVWHYTYENSIKSILDSAALLPPIMTPDFEERRRAMYPGVDVKDRGFQADAKMLLFSAREDWEPASYRGISVGGRIIDLHKLEDYETHGVRVYRIGVDRDILHPWVRLKRLCGMPHGMAKSLETIARKVGSNPFDWWGTMRPIPIEKWRSIEVYDATTKTWKEQAKAASAKAGQ